jgi:dethiobiotin synthetase
MIDPRLAQSLFIAGTDTGVGKTWVAAQIIQKLVATGHRAVGMKPVAAGAALGPMGWRNDDALQLAAAGAAGLPYELLNPVCLPAATSPHLAAKMAGTTIDIADIKRAYESIRQKYELIIVESAGGWFAPIGEPVAPGERGPTMEDVASSLRLPVLLVVGVRLGCISHALLTAAAIQQNGLHLVGWVANRIPEAPDFPGHDAYVQSLTLRLPAPCIDIGADL